MASRRLCRAIGPALLLLTLAGCPARPRIDRDAAAAAAPTTAVAWPALPRDAAEAERLIAKRTLRDPSITAVDLSPTALLAGAALTRAAGLIAGEQAVWTFLGERLARARAGGRAAFLLFGTFHDSGGQLRAFRRSLGPGALSSFDLVTLEQLDADGAWTGVPPTQQLGDQTLLDRLLTHGEAAAWAELGARQVRQDYTAWKYGFVDEIVDLVLAARGLRLPMAGCDMPRPLQERATVHGPTLDRLRELHCLFALEQRLARTRRRQVAMVWGQDHLRPHGLRRFLPPATLAISVFLLGERPGPLTPEAELARHLVVNDLLLVPLDATGEQLALLLPGPPLGGELDRSREWARSSAGRGNCQLRVGSKTRGELSIAGRRVAVGPEEVELSLPPSTLPVAYVLAAGKRRVAGALELVSGSSLEIWFDLERRSTRLRCSTPRP